MFWFHFKLTKFATRQVAVQPFCSNTADVFLIEVNLDSDSEESSSRFRELIN